MNPTDRTAPSGPALGVPAPTDSSRDQRIRLDAIDRAIGLTTQRPMGFNGTVDDFVLAVAARFEAYIRDGAA